MDSGIKLTFDTILEGCLTLHPNTAKRLGITEPVEKGIRFGTRSFSAKILPDFDMHLDEASLSVNLKDKVRLPSNCRYEIQLAGEELQIGPYIGLLAGYYKKSISHKLDDLQDYLSHYSDIKGAILVFCIENIDQVNQTVNGYLYNPVTRSWDEGVFPYPSAIFIVTKAVSRKWINHFESILGHRVINHFHFNKWEAFNLLAASAEVKSYLPRTILYQSPQQLFSFLKKHPFVHVKSINVGKSSQIYRISRDGFYFVITDLKRRKEMRINCVKKDQAYEWFSRNLKEGEYLIKNSFDSNQISSIDLRTILIKDEQGNWKNMGIFGRKGTLDDYQQPIALIGKDMLTEVLKLSDVISSLLIHEVQAIAIEAIHALENSKDHLANAAIDLTVDDRGRIWIQDMHPYNHANDFALVAGYPELYYQTLKTNMLYAKNVAGFN